MDRYGEGKKGEVKAREYLKSLGYKLLDENVGYKDIGELDIVAMDGTELVFVEVRYRSSTEFGHPLETITKAKISKVIKAAGFYMAENFVKCSSIRFDVIAILREDLQHIKNAFCSRW